MFINDKFIYYSLYNNNYEHLLNKYINFIILTMCSLIINFDYIPIINLLNNFLASIVYYYSGTLCKLFFLIYGRDEGWHRKEGCKL